MPARSWSAVVTASHGADEPRPRPSAPIDRPLASLDKAVAPRTSIAERHAKYIAHELTRRFPADSAEKLATTLAGAQVDVNPHQVDAALDA